MEYSVILVFLSTFITDTTTVGLLIWLITKLASLSAIFLGIIAGIIISIFAPKQDNNYSREGDYSRGDYFK